MASLGELEPLVAHVDDDVALVEEREERGNGTLDRFARGDKKNDAPRLLETRHKLGEIRVGMDLKSALLRSSLFRGHALGHVKIESRDRLLQLLRKVERKLVLEGRQTPGKQTGPHSKRQASNLTKRCAAQRKR